MTAETEHSAAEQAEREAKLRQVEAWLIELAEEKMSGHSVAGEINDAAKIDLLVGVWDGLDLVAQKMIGVAIPDMVHILRKQGVELIPTRKPAEE